MNFNDKRDNFLNQEHINSRLTKLQKKDTEKPCVSLQIEPAYKYYEGIISLGKKE